MDLSHPLEEIVNANQCIVLLTNQVYPRMKHFYPSGSGLGQDDSASIHSAGGLTEWFVGDENWCKSYARTFTVTRSQPDWAPMGDFGVMVETPLYNHHYQNTNCGKIFCKNGVKTLCYFYYFNLSPIYMLSWFNINRLFHSNTN